MTNDFVFEFFFLLSHQYFECSTRTSCTVFVVFYVVLKSITKRNMAPHTCKHIQTQPCPRSLDCSVDFSMYYLDWTPPLRFLHAKQQYIKTTKKSTKPETTRFKMNLRASLPRSVKLNWEEYTLSTTKNENNHSPFVALLKSHKITTSIFLTVAICHFISIKASEHIYL